MKQPNARDVIFALLLGLCGIRAFIEYNCEHTKAWPFFLAGACLSAIGLVWPERRY